MASIFKHGDKYRAQVTINGSRKSRLFRTKREASAWAEATSHSMRSKKNTPEHTLADCVMRYAEEETPKKRGAAKEAIRLSAFLKERGFPAEVKMTDLNVAVMSKGNGVTVTRFWKSGNVDYKKIPELSVIDLDAYRAKGRFETRITIGK